MRAFYRWILVLPCVVLATDPLRAQGSANTDSWENLKRVTHRRIYTFENHQRNCFRGQIVKVTDQDLTFEPWSQTGTSNSPVGMDRAELLRVTDGSNRHTIVYSGRSSWSDVQLLQDLPASGKVELITKDGRRHQGQLSDVSEDHATMTQRDKSETIVKKDVARVYLIRPTPASDSAELNAEERFYFDPELWPYMLNIAPRISVRLYDFTLPEDNGPVACKNDPLLPKANFTK